MTDTFDYEIGNAERIIFHFEGDLSNRHVMNFYESARFQYAAARLVAKLANFQATGKFPQKISHKSNVQITLESQAAGSFDISILAPLLPIAAEAFVTTPVSSLMSYVFERLVSKTDDDAVLAALNSQDKVVEQFGNISDNNTEVVLKALEIMQEQSRELIESGRRRDNILDQRLAEMAREKVLDQEIPQLAKIDEVRSQRLLSMSAPLVKEMATALRTSADTLDIITEAEGRGRSNIIYLNKVIARDIETSTVDDDMTSIRVDIIQYNKESGWGKLRFHETNRLLPFNVPTDLKDRLRQRLFIEMDKKLTFIQAYYVRDRAGEVTRLILVGLIPEADVFL